MDKQEYLEFLEAIRKGYREGDFELVAAYADQVDFKKIKDAKTLEMISDSYARLNEPDNAIEALLAASDINTNSRQIAYKLCELSIQLNDLESAEEFYKEYCDLSNNASDRYILKYEIGRAAGTDISELIKVLEAYNNREKDEKWEYELARAYHEAGKADKCVETCDDICLWYAEGEYVKKALELKFSHVALTPSQQRKYESMMSEYLDPDEMTPEEVKPIEQGDIVADQLASEYLGEGQGEDRIVEPSHDDVDFGSLIAGIAKETQANAEAEAIEIPEPEAIELAADEEIPEAIQVEESVEDSIVRPEVEVPEEVTRARDQAIRPLTNEEDDLEDTKVLSISEIIKQLDLEEINAKRTPIYPEVIPEDTAASGKAEEAIEADSEEIEEVKEAVAEEVVSEESFEEKLARQVEEAVGEEQAETIEAVVPELEEDFDLEEDLKLEAEPELEEVAPKASGFVLPDQKSASITMDQLRMMIHEGNRKKAESGVFFTYNEPTEEEIAEEAAQKAAREAAIEAERLAREKAIEERRLAREREIEEARLARKREIEEQKRAEEAARQAALEAEREAARKAAEEEAAREAAMAAAREAKRLEEETIIEEAMKQAEEQRIIAAQNDFDTAKIKAALGVEEAASEMSVKEDASDVEWDDIFAGSADEVADEVLSGMPGFDAAMEAAAGKADEDIPDDIEAAMADELADLFAEEQPEAEVIEASAIEEINAPEAEIVEAETEAIPAAIVEEAVEAVAAEEVIEENEEAASSTLEPWDEVIDPDGDLEETQFISRDEIAERIEMAERQEEMAADRTVGEEVVEALEEPVIEADEEPVIVAEEVDETSKPEEIANEPTFDDIMSDEFFQEIVEGAKESEDMDFDALFNDVELSDEQTNIAEETDPEVAAFLAGIGMATAPIAGNVSEDETEEVEDLPEGILDILNEVETTEEEVLEAQETLPEITEEVEVVEETVAEAQEEAAIEEIDAPEEEVISEMAAEATAEVIEEATAEISEDVIAEEIEEAVEEPVQTEEAIVIPEEVLAEVIEEAAEEPVQDSEAIEVPEEELAEVIEETQPEEDYSSIKVDPEAVIEDIALEGILNIPEETVVTSAANEVDEVVVRGSDITSTQIFSKIDLENDSALDSHMEEKLLTPEERLGAAIQRILMKTRENESVEMEETKSIRVVIPKACAGKLGVSNSRLSAFASSVIKPKLANEIAAEAQNAPQEESLRIIDNVDFSYIPIANEDDGQLGLNIDMLSNDEEYAVEGQMSIDEVLENFNPETNKFEEPEKVESEEDIAAERLRQIQQAVNLTAPVQLPYAMDDLMFDDIEVTDVNGNAEEVEGDIFKLNPENIGIIAPEEDQETKDDSEAGEVAEIEEAETSEEPVVEEIAEADVSEKAPAEESETEAAAEEIGEEEAIEALDSAAPSEMTDAEKAIAAFEQAQVSEEEPSEVEDEFFDVMAELEVAGNDEESEFVLEDNAFDEVFDSFMADEQEADTAGADAMNEVQEQVGYVMPESVRQGVSEFLLVDGMEAEISGTICNIADIKKSGNPTGGNLVVTGDIKSGKTFLAIEVIKAVSEELGVENGKVAKVQAELLNGKNIEKVFEKIGGSDLIIENVGFLADEMVRDLTDLMKQGKAGCMVVIEGNQLAVESLFNSFPEFAELFENRLDIKELSIVQWADLAIKYADEKGYVLDDMAKLALHAKINEINLPTVRLGYDKIKAVVDQAIERAERRNSGKLFAAFSKKNDAIKREMIESDFI